MVIRVLAIALVLLLAATPARAELIQLFGAERVGSSGGQFLRVPAGARTLSLGSANGALARGASSVFGNPAAMSTVRFQRGLFASHFSYAADIDVHHLAFVQRDVSWQYGVGVGVLSSGEIERTTETQPTGTGDTFRADQFVLNLSAARLLTDRFTLGVTGKFLQESLDDFENRGLFLDLGALYYVGFRSARIGFALQNFGTDMRIAGDTPEVAGSGAEWQSYAPPTSAVFGFAYDQPVFGNTTLTLALDFVHPTDETEVFILASEWELGALALRGSYRRGDEIDRLSGGIGLQWYVAERPIHLDYGVVDQGGFGVLHAISLEIER